MAINWSDAARNIALGMHGGDDESQPQSQPQPQPQLTPQDVAMARSRQDNQDMLNALMIHQQYAGSLRRMKDYVPQVARFRSE